MPDNQASKRKSSARTGLAHRALRRHKGFKPPTCPNHARDLGPEKGQRLEENAGRTRLLFDVDLRRREVAAELRREREEAEDLAALALRKSNERLKGRT